MAADYTYQIDWNGDGDFSDTGEDVSARVLRRTTIDLRYGRDQARQLAPTAPGEASFELNNVSQDYSPENGSSPLAGLVRPGRQVRIQATLGGDDYGLLLAFMDDFRVRRNTGERSVQLTCVDALARLRGVRVTTGVHAGLTTGQAIAVLLDAAGWPQDLRDLDPGATTIPWFWLEDVDAYDALQQLLASEGPGALATVDIDGQVVFRDRHHRLLRSASTTVQATFRDTGSEPLFSSPVDYDHGWKDIVNSVSFSVPMRTGAGTPQVVWSTQGQRSIADGETLAVSASSSDPFTGALVPVAGTDYQLVSGTVQVSLSRTSGQSATVLVKAVGGPAVIADLQLRARPLTVTSTVQVTAQDPLSIAQYGRRSLPSTHDPVWASLPDAQALCYLILAQRAERLPVVTFTVLPANDTRLTQQLARDLSDRIRIVDAELVLDDEFFLEQIQHTLVGTYHTTRFGAEKAPAQVDDVFILGSATNGVLGTNRLGRRGLDDPANVFVLGSATGGVLGENILGV